MYGERITMLGTGEAVTTHCYNTCFTLQTSDSTLLVDGGGGNGILVQLERTGISIDDIDAMFVTHCHTDHILEAVWVIRMATYGKDRKLNLQVYGNDKVISALKTIISLTFNPKDIKAVNDKIDFHELQDGDSFSIGDISLKCFDIRSPKAKQFGFRAVMPSGTSIVCLGDEPYNPANKEMAEKADWLMHEAFCLYSDREKFYPYEKRHSTALDAGRDATLLNTRNLILYHTEDTDLQNRKRNYSKEAFQEFKGMIYVPDDLEVIYL